MKQHGAEKVRRSFSVDAFILMLAKIGHCIAYATLNAEDLVTYRLFVPDYLYRRETDVLHIVGGVGVPPGHTDLMHDVEVYTLERPDRELLCAKVRLFAFMGAPEHLVVVGERPLGLPAPRGA
ncbi:MAG: hypothetical protein NW206_15970 [Hyphomonadaceae bacterium]|nr:hypothetical protein [Hyphomonadaceae bacterium]